MATYAELLRDPRWQRKRLEIMGRADFSCEECGAKDRTLNVHHKLYRKGAKPWDYEDHELACLCHECHEVKHHWRSRLDEAAALLDTGDFERLVGFAEALVPLARLRNQLGPTTLEIRSIEHAVGVDAAVNINPLRADEFLNECHGNAQEGYFLTARELYAKYLDLMIAWQKTRGGGS